MRTHGIVGYRPRRRRSLTRPDATQAPAPDLLGRLLDPDQPDVAWCGDITSIPPTRADCTWPRSSTWPHGTCWATRWASTMTRRWSATRWTPRRPPAASAACPTPSSTPTGAPRAKSSGRRNTPTVREWWCGEPEVASGRSSAASSDAVTGAAPGQPAGDPVALLAQDRPRTLQRGCGAGLWRVDAGGHPVVPPSWWHATHQPRPAVGALPVICRARGDRAAQGTRSRRARDRPEAGPVALHDLA